MENKISSKAEQVFIKLAKADNGWNLGDTAVAAISGGLALGGAALLHKKLKFVNARATTKQTKAVSKKVIKKTKTKTTNTNKKPVTKNKKMTQSEKDRDMATDLLFSTGKEFTVKNNKIVSGPH